MADALSEIQEIFIEEAKEGLVILEDGLLNLNADSDPEDINTIFRAAHSIKGGSATFGFPAISAFTHVMETLLGEVRDGTRVPTRDLMDLLLDSTDVVAEMVDAAVECEDPDEARIETAKQKLLDKMEQPDHAETDEPAAENKTEIAFSEPESESDAANVAKKDNVAGQWHIVFRPLEHFFEHGNEPMRFIRELMELGETKVEVKTKALPDWEEIDPEVSYFAWDIQLTANVSEELVRAVFDWAEGDCELTVEALDSGSVALDSPPSAGPVAGPVAGPGEEAGEVLILAPKKKPARSATGVAPTKTPDSVVESAAKPAVKKKNKPKKKTTGGSIRVGIDKIDDLINQVGELVITQSMLSRFGEHFDPANLDQLMEGLDQLRRNTRELQEGAMRIRMLPISTSFDRFPRLIRDLSRKLDKKVELQVTGEGTELDKTVLEKIADPLVHLVRNSLDHGLETPDIRVAAGKPEVGILFLNAYHQGGNIFIEVADDGAGLNRERIISKALSNGLIEADQELTDHEINHMIFRPGFSTAEVVSDVSGRGVGMDVVMRNIEDLGGQVTVTSTPGKGSSFLIRLPLTLAILDGQLARVADQTFVLPLLTIVESRQLQVGDIETMAGNTELYRLRDDYIPVLRLSHIFGINRDDSCAGGLMMVVENESTRVGLVVDELLGQQQVVIKSLETHYKPVEGLQGATILGDGTVALIIDPTALVNLNNDKTNIAAAANRAAA